jgi:hypothetical protein
VARRDRCPDCGADQGMLPVFGSHPPGAAAMCVCNSDAPTDHNRHCICQMTTTPFPRGSGVDWSSTRNRNGACINDELLTGHHVMHKLQSHRPALMQTCSTCYHAGFQNPIISLLPQVACYRPFRQIHTLQNQALRSDSQLLPRCLGKRNENVVLKIRATMPSPAALTSTASTAATMDCSTAMMAAISSRSRPTKPIKRTLGTISRSTAKEMNKQAL